MGSYQLPLEYPCGQPVLAKLLTEVSQESRQWVVSPKARSRSDECHNIFKLARANLEVKKNIKKLSPKPFQGLTRHGCFCSSRWCHESIHGALSGLTDPGGNFLATFV